MRLASIDSIGLRLTSRRLAGLGLGALLIMGACSTDKVTVPPISGPSEFGLALNLTALPDILIADGASRSVVRALVSDQNGHPKSGQGIFFAIVSSGDFADVGGLSASTAVSGPDGTALVVYTAPPRTDFTGNGTIQIAARPVGTDATGALYRTVSVELHSAEGRLFPPRAGNAPPTCTFAVEAPFGFVVNQSILFQTTASDSDGTIVRYFWTFGDASGPSDKPDVEHHYGVHGGYTVTLTTTDNNGGQSTCPKEIRICDGFGASCPQP